MSNNPYAPPAGTSLAFQPTGGMLLWNLGTIAATACLGGIGGMLLGILIAVIFPGYYAAVFSSNVNGFEVGAGLGLVQGAGTGVFVGIALVAIHYLYRLKWTREQRLHEAAIAMQSETLQD